MTKNQNFRTESDLLGTKNVPEEALYGVQTYPRYGVYEEGSRYG